MALAAVQNFRSMLTEKYKIDLSDEDYTRLIDTFDSYGVGETNCSIDLQSDLGTFITNLCLTNETKINRMHTRVLQESIIYELRPVCNATYTSFETIYPRQLRYNKETLVKIEDMPNEKNIVLIRILEFDVSRDIKSNERFSLVIFNPELKVKAGIMFETIPKIIK